MTTKAAVTATSRVTTHMFHADIKKGTYGEYLVKRYMHKFHKDKIDYAEDKTAAKKYQKADIDFLVSLKNRSIQSIEVKNDSTLYENLFYETISAKREHGEDTPGCMLVSEADTLFYVFEGLDLAIVVSLPELREWVDSYLRCGGTFKTREVPNVGYTAEGYLVPVKYLMGEHPGWAGLSTIRIVDLSTNEHMDYKTYDKRRRAKLVDTGGEYYVKVERENSWEERNKRIWRDADQIDIPLKKDIARYNKAKSHINKWMK